MQQFMRKFTQLNGVSADVIIKHDLFDGQQFYCDRVQTINDDHKIGVIIKGHEIFMYKQDLKIFEMHEDEYRINDGRLTIIVKEL